MLVSPTRKLLELTEESMNLAGFNSMWKITKQTKTVSKRNIALPHCRKWQELTNVRTAFSKRLRQYFPRVRNNYLLRRETCSVFHDIFENFLRTLTFFFSLTFSILNQIVSDCTPPKTSCKTVWTKVNPASKVFMHFDNSRESETANKWDFESKECVTASWEMKDLSTRQEKLLQGGWGNFFSRLRRNYLP